MRAEPSWLIPRKLAANLDVLIAAFNVRIHLQLYIDR